jgi:FkbM family methyltransferase
MFVLRARKLWTIAVDATARKAFRRSRVVPSIELVPLLERIDADTVVDVGANVGQFTLLATMYLRPQNIIAFEPLTSPAETFRAAFADDDRITLHQCAIGRVESDSLMHVSKAIDSSSLLPITDLQTEAFPGTGEVATEMVKVRRLDSIISADDLAERSLLKIDVQGYELEVLKGCGPLLANFRWVIAESSFVELYEGQPLADELIAWLAENGLVLRGVTNTSGVQADFLFERKTVVPADAS